MYNMCNNYMAALLLGQKQAIFFLSKKIKNALQMENFRFGLMIMQKKKKNHF